MIKIGVLGARGRMGSLVCQTIRDADDIELVAEVDLGNLLDPLEAARSWSTSPARCAVMGNLRWCLQHGRDMVIGTSGFDASAWLRSPRSSRRRPARATMPESKRPRILVVPNFSVGAVLMMKFAEQAARFFESAEIIELHHPGKVDAPSGTAARTAAMIKAARASAGLGPSPDATTTQTPGARGATVDEVHVHSIRLSGLVAHQEVLLGGAGEIAHDPARLAGPGLVHAGRTPGRARYRLAAPWAHRRPGLPARPARVGATKSAPSGIVRPVGYGRRVGVRREGEGRRCDVILNLIWLVFCGIWLAIAYALAGLIAFVLIITIPFGIASFRIANYVLWPFGRTTVPDQHAGVGSLLGNISGSSCSAGGWRSVIW